MDNDDLRTIAQWYIGEDRYSILWHHIESSHPLIDEYLILNILRYGYHYHDKKHSDRYVASGKIKKKKYRVVYEYTLIESKDWLIVITAFEEGR